MLADPTVENFLPFVGTAFTAGPPEPITFELISADRLPAPPPHAAVTVRRRPFALVFLSRTPNYVPQGLYAVDHGQLGRLDLFLVPVGRTDGGALMEAVFA